MKILFDQGTPVPLRKVLIAHHIVTAHEMGCSRLENGDLLAAAEGNGFELFLHWLHFVLDASLAFGTYLDSRLFISAPHPPREHWHVPLLATLKK